MLKSGTWEKQSQKDASKTRPRMQKGKLPKPLRKRWVTSPHSIKPEPCLSLPREGANFPGKKISGKHQRKGYKGQSRRERCGGGGQKLGELQAGWKDAS